jgi:hypothetical protein
VIWVSILGVLPFTLLMPYASLRVTELLTVIIGLILASAFSAIVVFAQELVPGRVGTVSGLSSDLRSVRAPWARRFWACSPTPPASTSSTGSVRSCPPSAC